MLSKIVTSIKQELPKFNDYMLIKLRENEIKNLPDFLAERYRECAEVSDSNLELLGYDIPSPAMRIAYELEKDVHKNCVNIRDDECILVNYNFRYFDTLFTVPLYLPYIFEDSELLIEGTHYECLTSMTEKLFSIRTSSNGVTIKVIRQPITFWRNVPNSFTDEVTGTQFINSVVSCRIYLKDSSKSRRAHKVTAIHYLLCKYSLEEMLTRFELPKDAAVFVEHENFEDGYYYFKVKGATNVKDRIYLKVRRSIMDDRDREEKSRILTDITSAITYIMSGFRFIEYNELVNNGKNIFLILLGKILHGINTTSVNALSYMVKHIASVDTYLDNYTKQIFLTNNIKVDNIYDVIGFVATNINQIVYNYPNNNMYNKRLESINNIVVDHLISSIYYRIYRFERKEDRNHMFKMVKKALTLAPRVVLRSLSKSDNVQFSPSIYSDNWLLSVGDKIVKRLSAPKKAVKVSKRDKSRGGVGIESPTNRFHPSMVVVNSAIGFSSSKPGVNCLANPYAEIDQLGGYVRNQIAEDASVISTYLTNDQNNSIEWDTIDD